MARRREHLSAYLRICVSARQQNHKKTGNNYQTPSENSDQHLKIKVPAGSNAYLRICVFVGVYIVQTVSYSRRMNRGQTAS